MYRAGSTQHKPSSTQQLPAPCPCLALRNAAQRSRDAERRLPRGCCTARTASTTACPARDEPSSAEAKAAQLLSAIKRRIAYTNVAVCYVLAPSGVTELRTPTGPGSGTAVTERTRNPPDHRPGWRRGRSAPSPAHSSAARSHRARSAAR